MSDASVRRRASAVLSVAVAALFAVASLAAPTSAADAPAPPPKPVHKPPRPVDLSGRWALDVAQTNFGLHAKPGHPRWDTIENRSSGFDVHVAQLGAKGDTTRFVWHYVTDGSLFANMAMGQEIRSTAIWEGPVLRVHSMAKMGFTTFRVEEHWSLSPDRQTLTIERKNMITKEDYLQKFVFHRMR